MKRLTILLAALGALLLVSAAPAYAAEELPFKETFGSAAQPSFGAPTSMAVDPASGDLYVVNIENQTLRRYKPNGEADNFSALGTNAIDGAGGEDATPQGEILSTEGSYVEAEVAVAPPGSPGGTAGNVYVTDAFNEKLDVFASSGKYLGQDSSFGYPCGVATDPAGNVFVGDYYTGVHKLTPTGSASFSESGASPYATTTPCQVAAGTGAVYAVNISGGNVHKIESQGAGEGETKYEVTSHSGTVAVDPATGHLFAGNAGTGHVEEFDVSGASEATLLTSTASTIGNPSGLAVGDSPHALYETGSESSHVSVYSLPEEGPTGPTNRRTLTLTKSAGTTGGIGTVSSKPKGINCGAACEQAAASMYKETPVTLTAKASTGSSFVKWVNPGGACDNSASTTCVMPIAEGESLEAVFAGPSKAILNPQALTLSKGESSGYGTVKAAGLACEAECAETAVLYQGPTGIAPKNKPGKTVTLKETPAFGSEFSAWTGCESNPAPGECVVTMEEATEVKAEFAAKPNVALTLEKAGSGTGTVSSKPKAINCGATCTAQGAAIPSGEAIVLKQKAATGMTFAGWSGGGCSGTGETCTVSPSSATTVTATFTGSPKPIANPQELTLTKEGSGFGTVKAAGLACEALCTQAVSLYQGPTGIAPKNKPGKTVTLKATSAPGTKAVAWTGCESNPTPGECVVTMEEATEVTASFEELE